MILISIIIYIYFYYNMDLFLDKRKNIFNVLSTKKYQIYFSILVCIIFFLSFFMFYRFLRIFLFERKNIDLKLYYNYIWSFDSDSIIFFIFLFFIFLLLKNYFFAYIRFSFLRVYFCFLLQYTVSSDICRKIARFDTKLENFLEKYLKTYAYTFVNFILYKLFRLITLIVFIYGVIFNNGVIYTGILPWYALYFCFLSVFILIKKLKINFDYGIYLVYTKAIITKYDSYHKLHSYQEYLFKGKSKYVFYSSSDIIIYGLGPNGMYFAENQDYKYI